MLVAGLGVVGSYVYSVGLSDGQGAVRSGVLLDLHGKHPVCVGCDLHSVAVRTVVPDTVTHTIGLFGGDTVGTVLSVIDTVFDVITLSVGHFVPIDVQAGVAGVVVLYPSAVTPVGRSSSTAPALIESVMCLGRFSQSFGV